MVFSTSDVSAGLSWAIVHFASIIYLPLLGSSKGNRIWVAICVSRLNRKRSNRSIYPKIVADETSSWSHELGKNIDGEPGRTHEVNSYSGIVGDLQDLSRGCHYLGLVHPAGEHGVFYSLRAQEGVDWRYQHPTKPTTVQINADARGNGNMKVRWPPHRWYS